MQTKVHKMPSTITKIPSPQYQWKDPDDKVYVVSGTRAEFDSYRIKKMNEGSNSQYYFVSSPEVLLGLSRIKGAFVGSWKYRTDIDEIQSTINIIKERMKYDTQVSTAAGFLAQEIDEHLLRGLKPVTPIDTTTITASSIGSSITSGSNGYSNLSESQIRDMVKKYIDEAITERFAQGVKP
jgi:hypothetical protein